MVFEVLGEIKIEDLRPRLAADLCSGIGHAVFYADAYPGTILIVTLKRQVFWEWEWRDRKITYKGKITELELAELQKLYEGDDENGFSEVE